MTAAVAADPAGFADAMERLHRLDLAQVGTAQAGMIRALLEDHFPAGLDGDDVRAVLTACARSAAAWLPDLDVTALITVLTSALGMAEPEELPALSPQTLTMHACLVIADLATGVADGPERYLRRAMAEIERAQTMEMP